MKPFATHKFGAHRCQRGEIKFPSKLERATYDQLQSLKNSGRILFFLRQIPVDLQGGARHVIDFLAFCPNGQAYFIESKGKKLAMGELKRKQAEEILGVQIHVVTDPIEIYGLLNFQPQP